MNFRHHASAAFLSLFTPCSLLFLSLLHPAAAARAEDVSSITTAPAALPPRDETQPPPRWTGDPAKAAAELDLMWKQHLARAIAQSPPTFTAASAAAAARGAGPGSDETNGISTRGVFRFALEAAALGDKGWYPDRIEDVLRFGRSLQDIYPASTTYGNFKWVSDADKVYDHNAVEFVAQLCGALHRAYANRLTPDAKKLLEDIMTTAIEGIDSHPVKPDYTNISIMQAWNLISLGEALNRPAVAEKGYARLDDWLRFTAQNGIPEFGATTYYGIDLDSLALIARFAARPEARAKALAAIRYLWTDAAANWWTSGDRLGCANSRTYDSIWSHGYFEAHAWTAGWLRSQPRLENAGWLPGPRDNLVALRTLASLPPPPEWKLNALRAELPRTVVQRTGADPAAIATNWIGRGVNLASSGMARGGDDRTLGANIGYTPAVPQMTLFMDGRGDPYGLIKTRNAAGQAKALHIVPFVATVQRGPEVLQALSYDPPAGKKNSPAALACLFTHLTIPAQADVWIGETKTAPGTPQHPAIAPPGAPIFIRLGDAVLAMRVLYASALDASWAEEDKPAPVQFIRDAAGLLLNRITIVHAATTPKKGRATAVVWLRAADGLDEPAFAQFRRAFTAAKAGATLDRGKTLKAWAAGLAGPLRIEADVTTGKRLKLEGGAPRPALLTVNGRELGAPIFSGLIQSNAPTGRKK